MRARDVMTPKVVTVSPETTISEVARVLSENRISGVPVISDGALVGIVTEGDLIRRTEISTDRRRRSWWDRTFNPESPSEFVKTHGVKAADVMTREVASVTEDTPVGKIADIFEARRIKRVPVLRGKKLVGIVSRANLIDAIARSGKAARPAAMPDSEIREILLRTLYARPWWDKYRTAVQVENGIVHYRGLAGEQDDLDAARIAAEEIPGVRAVQDHRFRMMVAEE